MDANIYIASGAFFVSLIALGLSLYEGYLTRKHNRISVIPYLSFAWNRIDNTIDVHIKNNGLGVAIIKSFKVSLDQGSSYHEKFKEAVATYDITNQYIQHFSLYPDESLAQGETQKLLFIRYTSVAAQMNADMFSNLIIEIEYESMYGEISTITLKDDNVIMSKIEPQFNLNEFLDNLKNSNCEK